MPTYEYRCEECNHQFEVFARMSDPDPEACESCGTGPLVKVLFPVAVHYKGSGFYSTDYSGSRGATASGDSTGSTGSGGDTSSSTADGSGSASSGSGGGSDTGGSGGSSSSAGSSDAGSSGASSGD